MPNHDDDIATSARARVAKDAGDPAGTQPTIEPGRFPSDHGGTGQEPSVLRVLVDDVRVFKDGRPAVVLRTSADAIGFVTRLGGRRIDELGWTTTSSATTPSSRWWTTSSPPRRWVGPCRSTGSWCTAPTSAPVTGSSRSCPPRATAWSARTRRTCGGTHGECHPRSARRAPGVARRPCSASAPAATATPGSSGARPALGRRAALPTFDDRSPATDLMCLHLIDPTANPLQEQPSPERLAAGSGSNASARRFGAWL